jgi:hypothetical protein
VGAGGVIPITTLKKIIFLKRDPDDRKIVVELEETQGVQYLLENDFCNPHQLVRDKRKIDLRTDFFHRFFKQTSLYLVNTTGTPQSTQEEIRRLLDLKK